MSETAVTSSAVAVTGTQHLPALIDRAASVLISARTAAEILDARDMANVAYDAAKLAARFAKAKGAHDELIAAAYRMQADALEIEAGAKRRLADEYDAAQERGEVATRADQNLLPDEKKVSVTDLGLSHRDIHDARQVRDAEAADPGIVRRALDEKLERGEEPTKAAVKAAVRAQREAQQAEHDRQREEHVASLPANIRAAEAAKEANRQKAQTRDAAADADETADASEAEDRVAELEEAVRDLTARNAKLVAKNKLYGEMRVQFEQGGFAAVIAGKDEEIRVLKTRVERESHDKVGWKGKADHWKKEAIKLGWKPDRVKIDTKTGALRDA